MKLKFFIISLLFVLTSVSCIHSRNWSMPQYKHLYYEVSISKKFSYKTSMIYTIKEKFINVKLERIKICKKIQTDIERIYLIKTVKYPRAKYYTMLGVLLASFSIPSYYMGILKSEGTSRMINFSVGTAIFMLPGSGLASYGLYKKSKEFTKKEEIGLHKREIKKDFFECGKEKIQEKTQVEILTKFGFKNLGNLQNGEINIDISTIHPLYSEKTNKYYIEVYLDKKKIGIIILKNYDNQ